MKKRFTNGEQSGRRIMKLPKVKLSLASRLKRKPGPTTTRETTTKSASSQRLPEAAEQAASQASRPLPTSRWGINGSGTLASNKPKAAVTEAKRSECAPSRRTVRFEYEDAKAQEVFLAGSFSNWDPGATQMGLAATGIGGVEVSLAPGRYEYLFVVDGRWTPDPKATDYLPNPFGGCNSVRQVE
jgi:hypothetical protein